MSLLVSALLVACTGATPPGFKGTQMSAYMPLDGNREASYYNDDAAVEFTLLMEKKLPTEQIDGVEIVELEQSKEEDGTILGAVKWSSWDGIQIHGWRSGTDAYTMFDTPVAFASDYMLKDESVVTTTNGITFTSTFLCFESCPVTWGVDWDDCAHIRIDDGDGDDMAGPNFAGDYWLVQRYGPAWMHLTGYTEKWNLARYEWSGDE